MIRAMYSFKCVYCAYERASAWKVLSQKSSSATEATGINCQRIRKKMPMLETLKSHNPKIIDGSWMPAACGSVFFFLHLLQLRDGKYAQASKHKQNDRFGFSLLLSFVRLFVHSSIYLFIDWIAQAYICVSCVCVCVQAVCMRLLSSAFYAISFYSTHH